MEDLKINGGYRTMKALRLNNNYPTKVASGVPSKNQHLDAIQE